MLTCERPARSCPPPPNPQTRLPYRSLQVIDTGRHGPDPIASQRGALSWVISSNLTKQEFGCILWLFVFQSETADEAVDAAFSA